MSKRRTRHRAKAGAGHLMAAAISRATGGTLHRLLAGGFGEPHYNGNRAAPRWVQGAIRFDADIRRERKRARCHELHGTEGMADSKAWQPSRWNGMSRGEEVASALLGVAALALGALLAAATLWPAAIIGAGCVAVAVGWLWIALDRYYDEQ